MDVIAQLLGGTPQEVFSNTYWRSSFLYSPGGGVGLLPAMPSLEQVQRLIGAPAYEESALIPLVSFPPSGDPVVRHWRLPVETAGPRAPGEPVNLPGAERCFASLLPLAAQLSRRFSAGVNLQLFYATEGEGLAPHTDLNDSFIIQIAGRKRWWVADVPAEGVPAHGNAGATLPADARVHDLVPGDVLYKPSQAVHATETLSGPSLSLTASIETRTARDVLLDHLRRVLADDPAWLEAFPIGTIGTRARLSRERLAAACEALAERLPALEELEASWRD